MNKDNAKAFLPLVQALAEGKLIEHRPPGGSKWTTLESYTFNDPVECYRIKHEPLVQYITFNEKDGVAGRVSSSPILVKAIASRNGWRCVRLVEDLDWKDEGR